MTEHTDPKPETSPPAPRAKRPKRSDARREARTLSLQVLFESDQTSHSWEEVLDRTVESEEPSEMAEKYLRYIIEGIHQHKPAIDREIEMAAPQFPFDQLSPVDRNTLRIAIFELRYADDVPVKVAINEAVELAKRFGGDSSGRFVNGVLGTVVDRLPGNGTGKVKR